MAPLNSIASLAPRAELDDAWQLVIGLISLEQITYAFRAAVELFGFSAVQLERVRNRRSCEGAEVSFYDHDLSKKQRQLFSGWQHIAARGGALQIYHLGKVMEKARGQLKNIPTLRAFVDSTRLRDAVRLFHSYFPNYVLIRDACAHSYYELSPSAGGFRSHAADKMDIPGLTKGRGIFITNTIFGNCYIVTKDKRVASYEISQATYSKLEAVRTRFISGFDNARAEVSKNFATTAANRVELAMTMP